MAKVNEKTLHFLAEGDVWSSTDITTLRALMR